MSQFPRPTLSCRECGKDWETHGKYCYPVIDRINIGLIILFGIAFIIYGILLILFFFGFLKPH